MTGGETLASYRSLYLRRSPSNAAPKCLSGSTSYLQVRLAFHSYTQLIQKLFNARWFGPPSRVTGTSPWPSVDHLVSRLPLLTARPLQTRFRFGSRGYRRLTSPATATRRFIMQKARRHPPTKAGSDSLQAHGFRVSFTPLSGFFSPFPRGTSSLSVSREYLALPDGPG